MCAAQSLQPCPALCDLMDGSLPGTSVPGILQARILEWVAIPSSWESSQPRDQTPCLVHLLHWQEGSLPQSPPGKPEIMHRRCQVHSFLFVCFLSPLVVSNSLWPLGVYGILQARIPEWVAFPFSKGSSKPRDQTQVSHIAGRFFTSWVTREARE